MRRFKSNAGITLVELIVAMAIGATVTAAALTIFLLGLRFHRESTDRALHQNELQIGITLIEKLVSESPVTNVTEHAVQTTDGADILYYNAESDAVMTGAGTQILGNVTDFKAALEGSKLLHFRITVDEEPPYEFRVYCPMAAVPEEEAIQEGSGTLFSVRGEETPEEIAAQVLEDSAVPYNVRQFLKTLTSQLGSTGRIQTMDGQGEYFSQWYIGSYEDNPGWSEDTPWCACFVSWALAERSALIHGEAPRFANVDTFWAEFVTADQWKTEDPEVGDIIFFDWITDGQPDPQHVGVVLTQREDWIYTVEGNTEGVVALRRYAADDARILGYGSINWR